MAAPKKTAADRAAALRTHVEEIVASTRVVGFVRLQPGLTPEELKRAEDIVLTAFADYRKGETGRTSSGFYLVRA